VFDAGKDSLNRFLSRGGVKNNFVGVFKPERNDVAFFEDMTFDFLAIQEDSLPVAAIFDVAMAVAGDNRSALPGNQRVGKVEVIPVFAATAHRKGPLGDAHRPREPSGDTTSREGSFVVTASGMRFTRVRNCSTRNFAAENETPFGLECSQVVQPEGRIRACQCEAGWEKKWATLKHNGPLSLKT